MSFDTKGRITPVEIVELKKDEIYVFESDEGGLDHPELAKKFGARDGQGFGLSGQTFAIPYMNWEGNTLPFAVIECYATRFCGYAMLNPKKKFIVTDNMKCKIEKKELVKPFMMCDKMKHVILPQSYWDGMYELMRETMCEYLLIEK